MDAAQVALFIVIIILTILLLTLGVQVFFILRDFSKTLSRANKVLDNMGIITQSVSVPISSLSGIAAGIKTGTALIGFFKKILSNDKEGWKKTGNRLLRAISEEGADNISNILEKADETITSDEKYEEEKELAPKRKFTIKETLTEEKPKVRRFFRGISRHLN